MNARFLPTWLIWCQSGVTAAGGCSFARFECLGRRKAFCCFSGPFPVFVKNSFLGRKELVEFVFMPCGTKLNGFNDAINPLEDLHVDDLAVPALGKNDWMPLHVPLDNQILGMGFRIVAEFVDDLN
jgi:hypothetical protein